MAICGGRLAESRQQVLVHGVFDFQVGIVEGVQPVFPVVASNGEIAGLEEQRYPVEVVQCEAFEHDMAGLQLVQVVVEALPEFFDQESWRSRLPPEIGKALLLGHIEDGERVVQPFRPVPLVAIVPEAYFFE